MSETKQKLVKVRYGSKIQQKLKRNGRKTEWNYLENQKEAVQQKSES